MRGAGRARPVTTTYDSSAIQVLTGLEPMRKRPGRYTLIQNPDLLAHDVNENPAVSSIAGHCYSITVTLHDDNSISVREHGPLPEAAHALHQRAGSGGQ